MIIAVDFDGTCVRHEFPKVGKEIGASKVLKQLANNGHQLILNTMRSSKRTGVADENSLGYENPSTVELETDVLQDAVDWFNKYDIPLWGVNHNPTQHNWTESPKVHADLYIDDLALGIPLLYGDGKPYVDWSKVELLLKQRGLIWS